MLKKLKNENSYKLNQTNVFEIFVFIKYCKNIIKNSRHIWGNYYI